jgi:hypothetical protein
MINVEMRRVQILSYDVYKYLEEFLFAVSLVGYSTDISSQTTPTLTQYHSWEDLGKLHLQQLLEK